MLSFRPESRRPHGPPVPRCRTAGSSRTYVHKRPVCLTCRLQTGTGTSSPCSFSGASTYFLKRTTSGLHGRLAPPPNRPASSVPVRRPRAGRSPLADSGRMIGITWLPKRAPNNRAGQRDHRPVWRRRLYDPRATRAAQLRPTVRITLNRAGTYSASPIRPLPAAATAPRLDRRPAPARWFGLAAVPPARDDAPGFSGAVCFRATVAGMRGRRLCGR